IVKLEQLQAQRNTLSAEIGQLKRDKKDASKLVDKVNEIKEKIEIADQEADKIIKRVDILLYQIPNLPYDEVPVGRSDL
ncbi:seryl-tRNA synthetase N-terminal domain protein, partial [Chlamydia psittaci 01DC11]